MYLLYIALDKSVLKVNVNEWRYPTWTMDHVPWYMVQQFSTREWALVS